MSRSPLDEMYKEVILDHHRDPRNFGELEVGPTTGKLEKLNPLCGDRVVVSVKVNPETQMLEDIRFKGEGCSICMASASIMTEEIKGLPISEVMKRVQRFRDLLQGKEHEPSAHPSFETHLESDVDALSGVKNFPVRIKCALLAWTTANEAVESASKKEGAHD